MKTRPRSCSERDRPKISWMTCWPGRSAGMGLAREDDLDRPLLVPQEPGQPVDVGEQEAGPLVGREAAGEADRQDVRIERRLERVEHRRRLAMAGELVAQPAPGEDRQLELLALVGLPQLVGRDARRGAPRTGRRSPSRVEVVEVGSQPVARASRPSRGRPSSGMWTPFVTPMIPCGGMPSPRRVGGLGMELADGVRARASAAARTRSCRTGPRRRRRRRRARGRGRAARRRSRPAVALEQRARRRAGRGRPRSARCRPRPACGS